MMQGPRKPGCLALEGTSSLKLFPVESIKTHIDLFIVRLLCYALLVANLLQPVVTGDLGLGFGWSQVSVGNC